jgi:hypothetical protein
MRGPDALMCVVRLKTRKEEGPPSNADWGTVQMQVYVESFVMS